MTLGGLMQMSSAFGRVQGALSWFVDNYATLVGWKAASNRLIDFQDAIREAQRQERQHDGEHDIEVRQAGAGHIGIDALALALPQLGTRGAPVGKRPLVAAFSLTIGPGERWLVTGPSGCGKSVLFRALAGIWPYGSGTVSMPPSERTLFLPQRSYLPIGTLADALAYPKAGNAYDSATLQDALRRAQLGALASQLDVFDNWSLRLSPGEQQRLAFARALLCQPDFLFLDEATSALDEETERAMYQLMVDALPGAAIVSIAHRSTVAAFHDRRLRYVPDLPADHAAPAGAPRPALEDGQGTARAVSYRVLQDA